MVTDKYILLDRAIDIRDTVVADNNSSAYIGGWCIDVLSYMLYLGYPDDNSYKSLLKQAQVIHDEANFSQNTALRLGLFCFEILEYAGIDFGKKDDYYLLRIRATIIRDEWKDGYNIRRLGMWFVDFLKYIDCIILLITEDKNYYITTEDNYKIRLQNAYNQE